MRACRIALAALLSLSLLSPALAAERPYLFMTEGDIAAAKKKIASEDWAKAELERVRAAKGHGQPFRNLFLWHVTGDEKARDAELKYLMSFAGAKVDDRPWSDNYVPAVRYDALYDQLTPEQRKKIEATFRKHIDWQLTKNDRTYTRYNWLPNMQWPRTFGMHLMAVALGEEGLIRKIAASNGGWEYYFNDYITDGYFYNEEFGKQGAMIGQMLLWCRGLEQLGMNELGWGYTGTPAPNGVGATMLNYMKGLWMTALPGVDLGTGRWHIPRMTMGDAKGGAGGAGYGLQRSIVPGWLTTGPVDDNRWFARNMNGRDHRDTKVSKLDSPLQYEITHAHAPDAGFGWLLAQMRGPDQEAYYPSLYFGLDPIRPGAVDPPAAESGVYEERGIALLYANEGPAMWTAPAPGLGVRLAAPYVHNTPDAFAITNFIAFNRPIFVNRQVSGGYAGVDPSWSNSVRSHSTVMVDRAEPRFVHPQRDEADPARSDVGGPGVAGAGSVTTRSHFNEDVKFLAMTGAGIYPGVKQTRAFALTDDYLVDVFALESDTPRHFLYMLHSLGRATPDHPQRWAATNLLQGVVPDLTAERSYVAGDRPWSVTCVQRTAGAEPQGTAGVGEAWYDRRVGVRVHMLGEEGTVAFVGDAPTTSDAKHRRVFGRLEPATPSIYASRNGARTVFVAVHEPFEGRPKIEEVERVAETDSSVTLYIVRNGTGDTVKIDWSDDAEQPFTFDRKGAADAAVDAPVQAFFALDDVSIPTGGKTEAELYLRNLASSQASGNVAVRTTRGLSVEPTELSLDLGPGEEKTVKVTITGDATAANRFGRVWLDGGADTAQASVRVAHGVVAERQQIGSRDFEWWVHAPRYTAVYDYFDSVATALVLGPEGRRRGGALPALLVWGTDRRGDEGWQGRGLDGYRAFNPRLQDRDGPGGETAFLVEGGQHPHGASSDLWYRFTEDWIETRYRRGEKGKLVVIDFMPPPGHRAAKPGGTAYTDRGPAELVADRQVWAIEDGTAVHAVFAGGEQGYGPAMFFPAGSVAKAGLIAHPAGEPVGFTYCTAEELPRLLERWQTQVAPRPVRYGQGEFAKPPSAD